MCCHELSRPPSIATIKSGPLAHLASATTTSHPHDDHRHSRNHVIKHGHVHRRNVLGNIHRNNKNRHGHGNTEAMARFTITAIKNTRPQLQPTAADTELKNSAGLTSCVIRPPTTGPHLLLLLRWCGMDSRQAWVGCEQSLTTNTTIRESLPSWPP